jgi:molecular chaperone GrpE
MSDHSDKKKTAGRIPIESADLPIQPEPEESILTGPACEISNPEACEVETEIVPTESDQPDYQAEIEELRGKLAQMTENWQRERAGFQNFKHRVEDEKKEIWRYANYDLALDIIRVIDYFENSVIFTKNLPKEAQSVIDGVEYSIKELTRVLAAHGVSPIEVTPGDPYDNVWMQAVERRESDDAVEGAVLEVQRRGWKYHDRVLRPAQVVVAAVPRSMDEETEPVPEGGENEL